MTIELSLKQKQLTKRKEDEYEDAEKSIDIPDDPDDGFGSGSLW